MHSMTNTQSITPLMLRNGRSVTATLGRTSAGSIAFTWRDRGSLFWAIGPRGESLASVYGATPSGMPETMPSQPCAGFESLESIVEATIAHVDNVPSEPVGSIAAPRRRVRIGAL
jgi:hypothetical protein